jgi:hypothetical protein
VAKWTYLRALRGFFKNISKILKVRELCALNMVFWK